MTIAEEIKELFELTTQRVAKIETETTREIAQIRKESEDTRRKIESETTQKVAKIEEETAQIRKETEYNRKIAEKRADEDFKKMREILAETDYALSKTSKRLGFYTKKVANISEEYFYRGLKSNVSVGGMTFDTIVRNIDIDGKEYDIILENDKAVMLVSVKTNIGYSHIPRLIYDDIVKLKKSTKYKSIDKKFYVAIAGFTGADKVLESAKKNGVFILTLSGEHQPTLVNSEVSPISY